MIDLADAINRAIESKLSGIHTALPGTIVQYDPGEGKAEVQPMIKKKYRDGEESSLPVITDVPVVFPRSGDSAITFPLKSGDGVLIVFSERGIAKYLVLGGQQPPPDFAKFSLTDAIAIPGLFPFGDGATGDNENLIVQFKTGKIAINPDGKLAIGNSAQELMDILDQLFTLLTSTTIATGIGTQPFLNVADYITLQTQFQAIKGTLP